MKQYLRSLSLLSLGSVALFVSACSAGMDGEAIDEEKAQAMAEDFDYVPSAEEENTPVMSMEDVAKGDELVGKGSIGVTRGFTWYERVDIANGATITYETTGGSDTIDPVLVLFMRTSPWNSTQWIASPYQQKVGIRTLAVNDDTSGRNSKITWTNNQGQTIHAWVMGFAYNNRTGNLTVKKNGSSIGSKPFASGSARVSSTAGEVYTTGGGDPVLFAFERYLDQTDNGAWNDDDPNGGTDSRIVGFTNRSMWVVPMVYPSFSRTAGTSTVHY